MKTKYEGSYTTHVGPIAIACISEDARALIDKIMAEWEPFERQLRETWPDKEITFYQFAYWLVRHSGLIQPANWHPVEEEKDER